MFKSIIKNWKTSVVGLVVSVINTLSIFGLFNFTEAQKTGVVSLVTTIGVLLGMFFAKDGDKIDSNGNKNFESSDN